MTVSTVTDLDLRLFVVAVIIHNINTHAYCSDTGDTVIITALEWLCM